MPRTITLEIFKTPQTADTLYVEVPEHKVIKFPIAINGESTMRFSGISPKVKPRKASNNSTLAPNDDFEILKERFKKAKQLAK